jgi:hypothetical protein
MEQLFDFLWFCMQLVLGFLGVLVVLFAIVRVVSSAVYFSKLDFLKKKYREFSKNITKRQPF